MKKTLIITGWGIDYACAAAIASLQFAQAELVIASQSWLPQKLAELAEEVDGYEQILILGVGLGVEPAGLIQSLRALKGQGVAVLWLSVLEKPRDLPAEIDEVLDIHCGEGYLCQHVSAVLGACPSGDRPQYRIGSSALDVDRILRLKTVPDVEKTDADWLWIDLLEAAAAQFRRFRELAPCISAIEHLARGTCPDDHEALIRSFRVHGEQELRGGSPAMEDLRERVRLVGESDLSPVLITGEPGAGKNLVARNLHDWSARRDGPFVEVNCAALSEEVAMLRLFSSADDYDGDAADTGVGALELAAGGSLFLDDIGQLPLRAQAQLAAVLEPGRTDPQPGSEMDEAMASSGVRIIAATSVDLRPLLRRGQFRADLYWRLCMFRLHCPPLRERREDIVALANDLLLKAGRRRLTPEQAEVLSAYDWPGNIWQLKSVIERALVLGKRDFGKLLGEDAEDGYGDADGIQEQKESAQRYTLLPVNSLRLADVSRAHVRRVLELCGGNKTRAAKQLDISVNTLKKYLGPAPP